MAETAIQWTWRPRPDGTFAPGYTFNPWIGCERVSPECDNCYADVGSRRLAAQHRLTLWDEGSSRYLTSEGYWDKPRAWNRAAEKAGEQRLVFCASYGDVFEDRYELAPTRQRLGRLIRETPSLIYLLLTKRPEKIARMVRRDFDMVRLPSNVWLGTTVGTKPSLERAVALVRTMDAAVKFLSIEPLLDPELDLDPCVCPNCWHEWGDYAVLGDDGATPFCRECEMEMAYGGILDPLNGGVSWVIVGGESGPRARPFHLRAARSIRDQCKAAGAAFFFKQAGAWPIVDLPTDLEGRRMKQWRSSTTLEQRLCLDLKDKHGGDLAELPEDLRVREFPISIEGVVHADRA